MFGEGKLPVRYLGVPLISKKLNDCKPIVERSTTRTDSWSSKFLSYAGIFQLIKSVLFSLQMYRTIMFILPKKVIKAMEQKLTSIFISLIIKFRKSFIQNNLVNQQQSQMAAQQTLLQLTTTQLTSKLQEDKKLKTEELKLENKPP
jgi:hypothetical protein